METMSSSTSSQPASQESTHRLHGIALISVITALMLTLLLEALDQTVVGTALPKIIGSLQGFDRYTWTVTAYILASTTMIPVESTYITTAFYLALLSPERSDIVCLRWAV